MSVRGYTKTIMASAAMVGALGTVRVVWAATASVGGAAQPVPSETNPMLGDVYAVAINVFNSSFSLDLTCVGGTADGTACLTAGASCGTGGICTSQQFKGIDVTAAGLQAKLSCNDPFCNNATPVPLVQFVDAGNATGCLSINDPCVTMCSDRQCVGGADAGTACRANSDCSSNSCGPPQQTTVYYRTNACTVLSFQAPRPLAEVTVQQIATQLTFYMVGQAVYNGTAGTCTSQACTNSAGVYCNDAANCNWTSLHGAATGSSKLAPAFCGNGIVGDTPGETCDPPASLGGGHCSLDHQLCSAPGTCPDFVDGAGGTCPGCIDGTQPACTCPQTCELNLNCRDDCTYCGDGIIDNPADAPNPNEQCDNDGSNCDPANPPPGCTCSTACLLLPSPTPTNSATPTPTQTPSPTPTNTSRPLTRSGTRVAASDQAPKSTTE